MFDMTSLIGHSHPAGITSNRAQIQSVSIEIGENSWAWFNELFSIVEDGGFITVRNTKAFFNHSYVISTRVALVGFL